MSKSKRRKIDKKAAEQTAELQAPEGGLQGKRTAIIITAVFILLIAIIVLINHYFSEDQKYYRINVVTVDDVSIRMDEFIRRCHATGSDPMSMLTNLTQEIIIRKEAEQLELEVSPQAIDEKLMEMAQGMSGNITQIEFREWYRQWINESGLKDEEYREITAASILASYFREAISAITPTTAEHVHLQVILLDTEEEAIKIKERLDAGESFADLASELSTDAISRQEGGDYGWIPAGVAFDGRFDEILFDLDVGIISEPVPLYNTSITDPNSPALVNFYLFMVSEKAEAREIDERYLNTIYSQAFMDWINGKMRDYDVGFHGINNGFDSTTYSWVNWQLQKLVQ